MTKHHIVSYALVAASYLFSPTAAFAVLLDGKTVEYQYLFDTITTLYAGADNGNKLVGPGVEVSNIVDNQGTLDISDTNLLVDFTGVSSFNSGPFNGFRIRDIFGAIPAFGGVTINAATNMAGLTPARITFDADNIWVNWVDLPFNGDTVVSLDLRAVPEPSSLLLAAICVFVCRCGARRRRSN